VAWYLLFGVENFWGAWAGAVSNPVAFVAFVVEVVPPPLQGKGRCAARAQTRRAWIQACGMVADVWWPFRSGGKIEGGGGAATLPSCWSVRTENYYRIGRGLRTIGV
jgi:hypothetical protein